MAGPLGTPYQGGTKAPEQTSATQGTSVGSGSRPGAAKMPIETSAPPDAHKIRPPPDGWLK